MLDREHKPSIISCLVSLISVFFTQFTLSLLPLILPASSFLALLPLSGAVLVVVVGLGRFCKRVAGVRASPPAFVLFSILFIWSVYFYVVRQVGLCRIMSLDPGFVTNYPSCHDSSMQSHLRKAEVEGEELTISTSIVLQEPLDELFTEHMRATYCRHCRHYVMGFDHHCPAFGNCIGLRNHALFIALLVGFVVSEAIFAVCASKFTAKSATLSEVGIKVTISRNLVISSMLFCQVQVVWQVVFIIWHVYCACFNIKTDEWINWKEYPEFQIKINPFAGEMETGKQFRNPYDKGILRNLKEFLREKG
ncbi:hypothetical protein CASFOL_028159 [Castilleja foliolosa]|uniref:S-acyltransferase n=1 Tax=Castilleja foliolosa TaxID=1961234 RepID=A0ABD3CEX2_9LAMI